MLSAATSLSSLLRKAYDDGVHKGEDVNSCYEVRCGATVLMASQVLLKLHAASITYKRSSRGTLPRKFC